MNKIMIALFCSQSKRSTSGLLVTGPIREGIFKRGCVGAGSEGRKSVTFWVVSSDRNVGRHSVDE